MNRMCKGTPAGTTTSLFLEPALLPSYEEESEFIDEDLTSDEEVEVPGTLAEPLYIALQDCAAISPSQKEGLARASCVTELVLGRPLECVTLIAAW